MKVRIVAIEFDIPMFNDEANDFEDISFEAEDCDEDFFEEDLYEEVDPYDPIWVEMLEKRLNEIS